MKWLEAPNNFVSPVGSVQFYAQSSFMISDDYELVNTGSFISDIVVPNVKVFDSPVSGDETEGMVMESSYSLRYGSFVDGKAWWVGEGMWLLRYSMAHGSYILYEGSFDSVPSARQDPETGEWSGDAWYQGTVGDNYSTEYSFSPAGTLLNQSNPRPKIVKLYHPRWIRVEDGASQPPFGKFVGVDGKTGTRYVGVATYRYSPDSGYNPFPWFGNCFRKGSGVSSILVFSRQYHFGPGIDTADLDDAQYVSHGYFAGPGNGWGLLYNGVLYFTSTLPTGEGDLTFSRWMWNPELGRYEQDGDARPVGLVYAGRTRGLDTVNMFITEAAVWR